MACWCLEVILSFPEAINLRRFHLVGFILYLETFYILFYQLSHFTNPIDSTLKL
jgi:hypothetical protein